MVRDSGAWLQLPESWVVVYGSFGNITEQKGMSQQSGSMISLAAFILNRSSRKFESA
jgi:hypothetical protein